MLPHVPQLRLSLKRLTHSPPHRVLEFPEQVVPHTPLLQTCPEAHWNPQPSQLDGSLRSSAQYAVGPVPHVTYGATQEDSQAPALQNWPAGHASPQAPQFKLSLSKSTQVPVQTALDEPVHVFAH